MNNYAPGQTDSVAIGVVSSLTAPLLAASASSIPTISPSACTDSAAVTDVQYYVSLVSFTGLSSATFYSQAVSLTWSTSGTTAITYSLSSLNGQSPPAWVTLDSVNQLLNFTTPTVSSTTVYQFSIQATVSGTNSLQKCIILFIVFFSKDFS